MNRLIQLVLLNPLLALEMEGILLLTRMLSLPLLRRVMDLEKEGKRGKLVLGYIRCVISKGFNNLRILLI